MCIGKRTIFNFTVLNSFHVKLFQQRVLLCKIFTSPFLPVQSFFFIPLSSILKRLNEAFVSFDFV